MAKDIAAEIRRSGALEALWPATVLRHDAAIRTTVDEAGRITPEVARSIRTPLVLTWTPGETGRKRAAQAGTAVLLAAHADTAPTAGSATITLTLATEAGGTVTVGTCLITRNRQFGEAALSYAIPAGGWLGATVTAANGAAGVSISCTVRV